MGFWNEVSKVGNAFMEHAHRSHQQREKQFESSQRRASRVGNDHELVKRFQNSSGTDKRAYASELENRGYLERGEDGKFKRTDKTL